jgi:hypothetical protein
VLPGSGGGTTQIFIGGRVTAVSSTSITIGGPGRDITAAVTASTQVTGKISGISGVKVGDEVSAQLAQSGGSLLTAVAIQDPAQAPGGGGPP